MVVAENGALLYLPGNREERPIAPEPPADFVAALRGARRRAALGRPRHRRHLGAERDAVLEAIRELGLELQVIFNKGAVMVLPPASTRRAGSPPPSTSWGCRRTTSSASATPRTTTPS